MPEDINRVSVKTIPFWQDRPRTWFSVIEAQFKLAGITQDETQYLHVLSNLNFKEIALVADIIDQPPDSDKYKAIKQTLIDRLSPTEEQNLRRLLEAEPLGDRKPSDLLRSMRTLAAPSSMPENLVRSLWLQRLPTHVQAIIRGQPETPLDTTAKLADAIVQTFEQHAPSIPSYPSVAQTTSPGPSTLEQRLGSLEEQLKTLADAITQQHMSRPTRERPNQRSHGETNAQGHCYYHTRFGAQARKCASPCTYQAENE